ncbi:MAG TPA: beta-propeller fold lactonase family protein [Candidatus Angelobacter sp.]|nr:beta-propeller fold lactonase family protein [Candidatus Angelobacter sp.]
MKAIFVSALIALLVMTAGCGSSHNIRVGSPIGPFIFMVGENSDNVLTLKGSDSGAIAPSTIASTGHAPSAVTLLSLSTTQINLFVTNSGSNTVSVLNLDPTTGVANPAGITANVGTNPMDIALREPLFNGTDFGAIYVLNRGSNSISGFRIADAAGHLVEVPGSPFATQANPQALVVASFGPSVTNITNFLYVANGTLGTISGFKINADGSLTELAGSPFAAGTNISALTLRPAGGILLASDAGANKVLGFKFQDSGMLTSFTGVAAGTQPGRLVLGSSDFVYVVNQGSNNVSVYKFDFAASTLTPVAGSPFSVGIHPVALGFTRANQLYVANLDSSNVSAFTADATTGALTPISGSPFQLSTAPDAMQTLFSRNVD